MKPNQLSAFLAVAGHGSIRAAARELGLSQPAVTRTIRELEHALEVPLMVRSAHGVELTSYGHAFRVRAHLLVEESRRARDELLQMKSGAAGRVNVAVSSLPAMLLLADVFARFRREVPQSELFFSDGVMAAAIPRLRSGELDLLVTQSLPETSAEDLTSEILFTTPTTIAARVHHPRVRARTLASLQGEEWTAFDRSWISDLFEANDLAAPRRILVIDMFDLAQVLVEQTNVIALFSQALVQRRLVKLGIRAIHVREALPELSIKVVRRADAPLTPASARFLGIVKDVASRLGAVPH